MAQPDKYLSGVTRFIKPGERSWAQTVYQSGKRVFDAELQLDQDIQQQLYETLRQKYLPSGWVKTQQRRDSFDDFTFPGTTANTFNMSKQLAVVAGYPVVVEYTNTTTAETNAITLSAPPVKGVSTPDVKRTDFVFLEVWLAEVEPSPRATGTVNVAVNVAPGDTLTVDGTVLTAVAGAPAANQFQIGGNTTITATNIAASITLNVATATASSSGPLVIVKAVVSGAAGNAVTLATSVPAKLTLSGANLAGGVDTLNKPSQDTIYRHGNVLAPVGVALADDLADPTLDSTSTSANVLSTKRVQVQYRIRTTSLTEVAPGGLSFKTEPEGFSNSGILAQGAKGAPVAAYPFVRADRTTVSANSSAVAYDVEDPGLWIAGSGTSGNATALGTVDGYVYAIPLGFVFRKNDDTAGIGFDPLTNTNGGAVSTHGGFVNGVLGAIPAGLSDRPDGAFADQIVAQDVLDLRRHVSPVGVDLAAELQYQTQMLLDGRNLTWAIDSEDKDVLGGGSGDVSTQFMVCNQIGRKGTVGGVAPGSGTTNRGTTIRNFDHIARRFGTQPVVERFVIEFLPSYTIGARPGQYVVQSVGGHTKWTIDDAIHLDLTGLDASTESTFDPATNSWVSVNKEVWDLVPTGTKITDVIGMWHDDGNTLAAIDQTVQAKTITGLGTGHVTIVLDANDRQANLNLVTGAAIAAHPLVGTLVADTGSAGRIFVEFEVTYPLGEDSSDNVPVGLTDTPTVDLVPDATVYPYGPLIENDAAQQPTDLEDRLAPAFRDGFREVQLEYVANNGVATNPVTDRIVSLTTTTMRFPKRVHGAVAYPATVTETAGAVPRAITNGSTDYGSSSRLVTVAAMTNPGQTLVDIEYFPQEAIPNFGAGGYQVGVYYRANSPQTVGIKAGAAFPELPSTLVVEPLVTANYLWTGQTAKGSVELPFPYVSPLDQIPVNDDGSGVFKGEWYFAATSDISIDDFNAEVGLLNLHSFTPVDGTTNLSITRSGVNLADTEFRAFFDGVTAGYYHPTAFTQSLSGVVRHKVFVPMLARATTDTELFRKNEVLLLVISRFAELDDENTVRMVDTGNKTAIGVYRTKNMLLIAGD